MSALAAHDQRGAGDYAALDGFGKRLLDFTPSQSNRSYTTTAGSRKLSRRAAASTRARTPKGIVKFALPWPASIPDEHRAIEARRLLGDAFADQAMLRLAAVGRAQRAEDHCRDPSQHSRLCKLHQHAIDSIRFLAGIFQKKNRAVEGRRVRCANRRRHHRKTSAHDFALGDAGL